MNKLWLVKVHDDSFLWGYFVSAVVWADTPQAAEAIVREQLDDQLPHASATRLVVTSAPDSGIVDYQNAVITADSVRS